MCHDGKRLLLRPNGFLHRGLWGLMVRLSRFFGKNVGNILPDYPRGAPARAGGTMSRGPTFITSGLLSHEYWSPVISFHYFP
jgi:hypothetical protein